MSIIVNAGFLLAAECQNAPLQRPGLWLVLCSKKGRQNWKQLFSLYYRAKLTPPTTRSSLQRNVFAKWLGQGFALWKSMKKSYLCLPQVVCRAQPVWHLWSQVWLMVTHTHSESWKIATLKSNKTCLTKYLTKHWGTNSFLEYPVNLKKNQQHLLFHIDTQNTHTRLFTHIYILS